MKKWSEKTTLEKTARVISETAFCIWIFFELLFKTEVINTEIMSTVAIFIVCICEAIYFWNEKRVISYIAIGGALLMTAAFVIFML